MLPAAASLAPAFVRVGSREGGRLTVRQVPLEKYVQTAILSEFAPAAGDPDVVERMFEVQAVVGRTYAISQFGRHAREGFDVCTTTHCQLYQPSRLRTSRWAAQAIEAVHRTANTVLWFDGAAASALFHADCGGRTSRPVDVWGTAARPYLVAIDDDGPAETAHTVWRYEAGRAEVQKALNADPRTRVGKQFDGLQVVDRDASGRAEHVAVHGTDERIVRGDALRDVLSQSFGARSVKSTWLDIRRDGTSFVFEGRGFGHGVGLCQAGALARIRAGVRLPAVLQKYFPGTKLVTLR
ncbi:MAG: SpoIID/LytB domain-containing protein [Acidobacteriota bacterium]